MPLENSTDCGLSGSGCLDSAIHHFAGNKLREECLLLDEIPIGQVSITRGYELPAKYVIHCVGPNDGSPHKLASCYQSALDLAVEHNIRTIAFPCVATGLNCFPLQASAQLVLQTTRRWLEMGDNRHKIDKIIFVFWRDIEQIYYTKWIPSTFPLATTLTYYESIKINPTQTIKHWAANHNLLDPWIYNEKNEKSYKLENNEDDEENYEVDEGIGNPFCDKFEKEDIGNPFCASQGESDKFEKEDIGNPIRELKEESSSDGNYFSLSSDSDNDEDNTKIDKDSLEKEETEGRVLNKKEIEKSVKETQNGSEEKVEGKEEGQDIEKKSVKEKSDDNNSEAKDQNHGHVSHETIDDSLFVSVDYIPNQGREFFEEYQRRLKKLF